MLYCIFHLFPLNGRRFDYGVSKDFVEKMVTAYLRGQSEITFIGRVYSVGSLAFQIYEVHHSMGDKENIEHFFNRVSYMSETVLAQHCRNVTNEFLFDRGWGELKEDYYNIYINDGESKPIITVLDKREVLSFLKEFSKGNNAIWVDGRTVNLTAPKTIKIFSIDFKWLSKDRGKIKEQINKAKSIYGKWNLEVLRNFGTEVTSDFEVNPFSSISSKTEKLISHVHETTPYNNKKEKIFISHSSKDEDVVKKFVDLILDNALGFDTSLIFCTSIEGLGIKSGADFRNIIKSELLKAKIVIQIITNDYKKSEVCLNEMGAAWVLTEEVIPFILGNNYDIGFIHGNTQQLKIEEKKDILQFIDDRDSFFPNKSGRAKIDRHINEFINAISK